MKMVSEKTLKSFRTPGSCEWCHRFCPDGRDPHHYWLKRGMGGGFRLDVRINLISLCRFCHIAAEWGGISKRALLRIVSRREGVPCEEIERTLRELSRRSKWQPLA